MDSCFHSHREPCSPCIAPINMRFTEVLHQSLVALKGRSFADGRAPASNQPRSGLRLGVQEFSRCLQASPSQV